MHTRIWLALAVLAGVASLSTLLVLQTTPTNPIWSDYARLLGWGGLASAAVLVVQGFWKASRDKQYMTQLRNQTSLHQQDIVNKYTESRVHGWRVMHIILSILVTTLAGLHGILLLPRLASPTIGVTFGLIGLIALLALGLSGAVTEANRKTKTFGSLKKTHLWLMVGALTLAELHAVAAGSTIFSLGSTIALGLLVGTIGMIGIGVEYASVKAARHYFKTVPQPIPSDGCSVNLGRRAALQKFGTLAVGTLVAISFAEAAALMPNVLSSPQNQQAQQSLVVASITPIQTNQQATGNKLGNLSNIPVNSAFYFNYPAGVSNILIRSSDGSLAAYSSTCTHQPCTVGYDAGTGLIRCPCHGALFDPKQGARVLQGPAPAPLSSIQLTVDSNGDIWLA
ncbi:MAG: Rieske (2Fe-2S) protein [Candidatus Bathyarchaeia archaeon]